MQSLSLTSQALTKMDHPGQIYDPLQINPPSFESRSRVAIDTAAVEKALRSLTVERHKLGSLVLNGH